MTPFREFCILVGGAEFSPSAVAATLGVSRDTVRQWLKRETMPPAVSIEVYKRRLEKAVELASNIHERLDEEDRKIADEETLGFLLETGIIEVEKRERGPYESI